MIYALTEIDGKYQKASRKKTLQAINGTRNLWSGKLNKRKRNNRISFKSKGKKSPPPSRPASYGQIKVQTSTIIESLRNFSKSTIHHIESLEDFSPKTNCRVYYLLGSIPETVDYQGYKGIIDIAIEELINLYGKSNNLKSNEIIDIKNKWNRIVKNLFQIF